MNSADFSGKRAEDILKCKCAGDRCVVSDFFHFCISSGASVIQSQQIPGKGIFSPMFAADYFPFLAVFFFS